MIDIIRVYIFIYMYILLKKIVCKLIYEKNGTTIFIYKRKYFIIMTMPLFFDEKNTAYYTGQVANLARMDSS